MLAMLDRRVGGLGLSRLAGPVAKMVLATAIMGAACWGVKQSPLYPAGEGLSVWATQLALLMVAGAVTYFAVCLALGVGVMSHLLPKRGIANAE
jgi:peptidoglycan biosynthesis protein MviN/MurJ (putative lipid II flippase)